MDFPEVRTLQCEFKFIVFGCCVLKLKYSDNMFSQILFFLIRTAMLLGFGQRNFVLGFKFLTIHPNFLHSFS